MEMHRVANLATLQSLLATFSLQKSAQTSFSLWEWPVLPRERDVLFSQRAHIYLSLSLSLCLSLSFYVSSVQRSWGGGGGRHTSPALLETGDSVLRISLPHRQYSHLPSLICYLDLNELTFSQSQGESSLGCVFHELTSLSLLSSFIHSLNCSLAVWGKMHPRNPPPNTQSKYV